jgi:hypothetical protein
MRPVSKPNIPDEPTPDDFVGAVIRTHEQIRSNLSALRRGAARSPAGDSSADARTINIYCRHHGVEATQQPLWQAQHRWLAG